MKIKTLFLMFILTPFLCLSLSSCKRQAVEAPSPAGPSTLYISFELTANPNIIFVTSPPQTSEIRALVRLGGAPAANYKVIFDIHYGPGMFADGSTRTVVLTDQNGIATAVYVGPERGDLNRDSDAVIRGQPETNTPYWIHQEVNVRLLVE